MKIISTLLLLCFFIENTISMEEVVADGMEGKGEPLARVDLGTALNVAAEPRNEVAPDQNTDRGEQGEEGRESALEAPLKAPSLNSIPVTILCKERGRLETVAVTANDYKGHVANVVSNAITAISYLTPNSLVKTLGKSSGEISASLVHEKTMHFPDIPISQMFALFKDVENRETFRGKGLFEGRCFLFYEKPYLGALIILDYNVGNNRHLEPGNKATQFYTVDDAVQVLKVIAPYSWLEGVYALKTTQNLMLDGSRFKDTYLNSHHFYVAGGNPEALFVDAVRKPGLEFVDLVATWIYTKKELEPDHKAFLHAQFVDWIRAQTGILQEQQDQLCTKFEECVKQYTLASTSKTVK
jgi:hypothetical protein